MTPCYSFATVTCSSNDLYSVYNLIQYGVSKHKTHVVRTCRLTQRLHDLCWNIHRRDWIGPDLTGLDLETRTQPPRTQSPRSKFKQIPTQRFFVTYQFYCWSAASRTAYSECVKNKAHAGHTEPQQREGHGGLGGGGRGSFWRTCSVASPQARPLATNNNNNNNNNNWRARCKNGLNDDFQWLFKILGNFGIFSQLHCILG